MHVCAVTYGLGEKERDDRTLTYTNMILPLNNSHMSEDRLENKEKLQQNRAWILTPSCYKYLPRIYSIF